MWQKVNKQKPEAIVLPSFSWVSLNDDDVLEIVTYSSIIETEDLPIVRYGVRIKINDKLIKDIIAIETQEGLTNDVKFTEKRTQHFQFVCHLSTYIEQMSYMKNLNVTILKTFDDVFKK